MTVVQSDNETKEFCRPLVKRRKKKPLPKIEIRIRSKQKTVPPSPSSANNASTSTPIDVTSIPTSTPPVLPHQFVDDEYTNAEQELEDTLKFFAETHEDQDPAYQVLLEQRAAADRKQQLAVLAEVDKEKRLEIENVVKSMYKEKQRATEIKLEELSQRIQTEQSHNLRRVDQIYQTRMGEIAHQINSGVNLMRGKHQTQMSEIRRDDHRAQLEAKHRSEVDDFMKQGEQAKKKIDGNYKKDQDKIRKHFQDRSEEEDQKKKRTRQKLIQNCRLLQDRYLKQHLQRMLKERAAIIAATEPKKPNPVPEPSLEQQKFSDRLLKPTEPLESVPAWAAELVNQSGGASRFKHRKGITSSLARQLSIEIHNEGVWMSTVTSGEDKQHHEFIPWGTTKVTEVLDAIICGEIPVRCEGVLELHPQAAELSIAQGGQVRCVLFDLRTSEETASQRRIAAMKEQEEMAMKDLERQIGELNKRASDTENEAKRMAIRQGEQAKAIQVAEDNCKQAKVMQSDFLHQYQSMIGADGKPIPDLDPNKAAELNQRLERLRKNVEGHQQKATAAKRDHDELKTKHQKFSALSKEAHKKSALSASMLKKRQTIVAAASGSSKNRGRISEVIESEKAATRCEDTVGALKRVAQHRRNQAEQMKKPNATSQWIQSFPNIPGAMKKSIWHKLHRRKHHVVLRPTSESMINEVRAAVTQKITQKHSNMASVDRLALAEKERLRAERLFLLATHPVAEDDVSPFPQQRTLSEWGEPGWKLNLSVPKEPESRGIDIIPPRKSFRVFEQNLAEMMSAPGRQAAAFLTPHTTRCLSSPLSAFSIASSPAEEATVLPTTRTMVEGDAFNVSDEAMALGYTFSLPPPRQAPGHSKKRSAASINKSSTESQNESPSKSSAAAKSSAPSPAPQNKPQDTKKPSSPRRVSTSKKTPVSSPVPSGKRPLAMEPPAPMLPTDKTKQPAPQQQQKQQGASNKKQQQTTPQQKQQQQQHTHHQQNTNTAQMQHRNQQLMQQQQQQQQNPMSHQLHRLQQRYPQTQAQAQQYQMAQLRMMQQQQQQAGSARHQLNPNFPPQALQPMQQFYNPSIHSYSMAIPTNPTMVQHARRHQSTQLQQQQHVHTQRQQQVVAHQQQLQNVQQQQQQKQAAQQKQQQLTQSQQVQSQPPAKAPK